MKGLLAAMLTLLLLLGASPAKAQTQPTYTVSGLTFFDQNGYGQREPSDSPLSHVQITAGQVAQPGHNVPAVLYGAVSGADGSYTLALAPGTYTIRAALINSVASSTGRSITILSSPAVQVTMPADADQHVDLGLVLAATPHDARYFPQTGFRIDNDPFWAYFTHRGGLASFGYPVSRTFPFLGFWTQVFQRQVMQQWPDGTVHLLNLLDPALMPITSVNFSTVPAFDAALVTEAPSPSDTPSYGPTVITFLQQHLPDRWNGLPVDFARTFGTTVTLRDAYPVGVGSAGQAPLFNLEIWGLPTSQPAYDPHNRNFVYQRFQRGIMHYDAGCNCTQGILFADTFKSVLTGQNLPADVALEMAASPYLKLYDPTQVDTVARESNPTAPRVPGWTDLAYAFRSAGSVIEVNTSTNGESSVAQSRASTTTIVPGGIASTTPPVTMAEISGTELTVAFTATLSTSGTLTVTAEEAGRAPTFTLRAPAGTTITASAVVLRAETSVNPGKTVAGPLPPAVQIVVRDRAGTPIARCAPAVVGTSTTTVAIPATCQAPGTTVTLYPLRPPATQALPPITPRTLPNTGMGGTSGSRDK